MDGFYCMDVERVTQFTNQTHCNSIDEVRTKGFFSSWKPEMGCPEQNCNKSMSKILASPTWLPSAFQRPPQNFPGLLCSCVSSLALVYIKSVAWSGQCFPVLYIHSNSVSVLFREILPMHFLLLYWEHSQEKYLDPCWHSVAHRTALCLDFSLSSQHQCRQCELLGLKNTKYSAMLRTKNNHYFHILKARH